MCTILMWERWFWGSALWQALSRDRGENGLLPTIFDRQHEIKDGKIAYSYFVDQELC